MISRTSSTRRWLLQFVILSVALTMVTGCQTFNMSEARFAEEQAGVYKDNAAGTAVIVGGTLLDIFAPDSWRQSNE